MYDLIIVGSGPAGMTAGIYGARREMKTMIVGEELGGQIQWASEIENYPGFKKISNFDLINRMQEQVKALGVDIKAELVQQIINKNNIFELTTAKNKYQAKTLILAMGLKPRRLSIPGEEKFAGKGVSYCANCDGPFYKNKTVAVIGGGNSALDAAEVLSKIAQKVYLVHRRQEFRGFEALVNEVEARNNIELILESRPVKIEGKDKVGSILVERVKGGQQKSLSVDGVFIEIGRIASTDLVSTLVERDDKDQILTDGRCRTKTDGLFAAGDVTGIPYKQITIACGQATIAALSAYEYLQLKQGNKPEFIFDRGEK